MIDKNNIKNLDQLTKSDKIVDNCSTEVFDITVQDNHNYYISTKDGLILSHNCLEFVIQEIIGPVVVVSGTTSLIPEIELIETGVKFKTYRLWTYSITSMLKNEARNKLILDHLFQDLKQHQCIIIPTDRLEHVTHLVKEINKRAAEEGLIESNCVLAYPFHGGLPSKRKQETLNYIETGECRVLVSVRSMIKQGIDMKKPTMLYHIVPESASGGAGSPYFYQLTNRVCTPYAGKPQPRIKMFLDDTDLSVACFKSLFGKEIVPGLKVSNHRAATPIYRLNDITRERMYDILKARFYTAKVSNS